MLIIRLSRQGKNKEPYFRLIISEKTKDTVGDFLESLGFYDPRKKILKINEERIKYWLSKGAQASATVKNLLITKGVMTGKKAKKGGRRKEESKKEEKSSDKKSAQGESQPKADQPLAGAKNSGGDEKTTDKKSENQPPLAPQKEAPPEQKAEEKTSPSEKPAANEEKSKK